MARIGELEIKKEIEWKIRNFSSLLKEKSKIRSSSNFTFCNESWYLKLYPNGSSSVGFISLFLIRKASGPPIKIEYTLGLKTLSGEKKPEVHRKYTFKEAYMVFGCAELFSRSELLEKKADLLPDDVITVFCSLKFPTFVETPGDNRSKKCFSCKESLGSEFISFHQKCTDRLMKCSDCSDKVFSQDLLNDHEWEKEKIKGDGSICEDFKKILQDGINHDLILKVGDKEIKAHKDVLRARCEVFKSMLEHDMKEKNSGVIEVSDCDPEAMEVFLSYIYCGKVDAIHENNMLKLYYIADKYQMSSLKEECCNFIKQSISAINFCGVIQLALNHSNSGLLDFATEYFNNNALDVLKTVEWQLFMKDNFTIGNELFIKYCENKK